MIWEDECYLLSKRKFRENANIINIFTQKKGKIDGIVYGGTSRKIKNYLQISNKLFVSHTSKSESRIGYFKTELIKPISPLYFDDHHKLLCITSAMNLIKLLTAESQKNENIFKLIESFYVLLESKNWIKNYVFWELELFKILGYDLGLKDLVEKRFKENKLEYITKSSSEKEIVPNFLIDKNNNVEDLKNLLDGLKLVGDFLDKTILKPNNLNQPISRLNFISALK